MKSVWPVLFQWLKDSPRLYLRSPLHINECVQRLQDRFKHGLQFFGNDSIQSDMQGEVSWHSFSLRRDTWQRFTPVFYGRLTRLDNGTLVSGHFTMPKSGRLRLIFLALGLSSFLFYLPFSLAPARIGVLLASWIPAALILAGFALLKPVGERTVALFVEFLEETLEAKLTSRKE